MKKFLKYAFILAAAVAVVPLAACSDDDEVDPYTINLAYMYQPESTYARLEYKANGEFLIDVEDPIKLMPVRLTKPAPSDITVEMMVDPALVDEYNKANNTNYVLLQGATIANPQMKIAAGEYITPDSVVVNLGDHKQFQSGDVNFIVPVAIKTAGPASISKSGRIFLTFTSDYEANFVKCTDMTFNVNTSEDGWETAFKTLTIPQFVTTRWAADDAISLNLAIDNSLIADYNSLNSTDYKAIDATLGTTTLNIAKGDNSADLTMSIGDYSNIDNEEYLIPVVVTVASGEGAEMDADKNVAYIHVGGIAPEVFFSKTLPSYFTAITPGANWTANVDGGADVTNVFKSNNTTNWTLDAGNVITIDLGEVTEFNGFSMKYQAYYYAPKNGILNVQTSVNGTNWTDWGDGVEGNQTTTTRYYELSKTVKARYLRYTNGPRWGSYYNIRMRVFTLYK